MVYTQLVPSHHQWRIAYGLSTTIMTDDDSQGRIEFDDLNMLVVKRTDPTNCELVQGRPGLSIPAMPYNSHDGRWRLVLPKWVKRSSKLLWLRR